MKWAGGAPGGSSSRQSNRNGCADLPVAAHNEPVVRHESPNPRCGVSAGAYGADAPVHQNNLNPTRTERLEPHRVTVPDGRPGLRGLEVGRNPGRAVDRVVRGDAGEILEAAAAV